MDVILALYLISVTSSSASLSGNLAIPDRNEPREGKASVTEAMQLLKTPIAWTGILSALFALVLAAAVIRKRGQAAANAEGEFHSLLESAPDALVITMICRLAPEKGIDVALESISQALTELPPEQWTRVLFVLAGEGSLREQIEADIKARGLHNNCRIWGEASPEERQRAGRPFCSRSLRDGQEARKEGDQVGRPRQLRDEGRHHHVLGGQQHVRHRSAGAWLHDDHLSLLVLDGVETGDLFVHVGPIGIGTIAVLRDFPESPVGAVGINLDVPC